MGGGGGGEQNPFSTLGEIQGKCLFGPDQLSNNFMHRKFIIHNVISLLLITITTHALIRERKYPLHSVIFMENTKKKSSIPLAHINYFITLVFPLHFIKPTFQVRHLNISLNTIHNMVQLKNALLHRFLKRHRLNVSITIDSLQPITLANT